MPLVFNKDCYFKENSIPQELIIKKQFLFQKNCFPAKNSLFCMVFDIIIILKTFPIMINRVARLLCVLTWVVCLKSNAKINSAPFSLPQTHHYVTDDNQRYLCVALLNTTEGNEQGLSVIREAAKQGCNAAMITVRWDVVYPQASSSANWVQFDNQVKLCKELGLKIFFRIHLARCCNRNEGFWTANEASRDQEGRIVKEIFSMSHQPSVNKALSFVREVSHRYLPYQQDGSVLCVAATTTTTQEAGYHYEGYIPNRTIGLGSPYLSQYDYTSTMVTGFQNWLISKYGTLKGINDAWRSDYSAVSDIQPVTTDYAHTENKRWADWYIYRHTILKSFLDKVSNTVKGVNENYKVVNDFGSVHDGLSFRRGTFAFKDLARNVDGTKINDSQYYNHYFSADVLRGSMGDKWIMNEAFRELDLSQFGMEQMLNQHFERGCKLVNVVINNSADMSWFTPMIKSIATKWLNKPMTPVVNKQKMVVKLSELVRTGSYGIPGYTNRWEEKRQVGPVEIQLIEDLLGEPEVNQPPLVKTALSDYSITAGFDASYTIPDNAFQDPDGTIESYNVSGLPTGFYLDKNIIKGNSSAIGTYKVTVTANDLYDASVSTTFDLRILAQKPSTLALYKAGNYLTRTFLRAVKDKDTLNLNELNFLTNFIATSDATAKAVVMKLAGPVSQTRTETDIPFALFGDDGGISLKLGSYQLVLEAYNSTSIIPVNGIARTTINFVVANQRVNQAPVLLTKITDQQATLLRNFIFIIPASTFQDKDGQISKLVITGLPSGMVANSGVISGTPTVAGDFKITVEAFDNENASVKTQFNLKVALVNQSPVVVTTIPNQVTVVQQEYTYYLPPSIFRDIDGYIVRVLVQNLPQGITYANNKLTGKAIVTGDFRVTVRAIDNENASVETTFLLTVKSIAANLPPVVITTIPTQRAIVGNSFTYALPQGLFEDPEGGTVRLDVPKLPIGFVYANGTLIGTPINAGEYKITVRGYDPVGSFGETTLTLLVALSNGNIPPVIVTQIPDQDAVVGEAFSLNIDLTGFRDLDGFLFGLLVRNLPAGLVFQNGKIVGTPTSVGNYTITVRAIDNLGATVDEFFVIRVTEANPTTANLAFSLFKAGGTSSRRFIRTLRDGDRVTLASVQSMATFVNIFAESSQAVDRIEFNMTGKKLQTFTDTVSPYGVFGDNGGFSTELGTYTLTAKAIKSNKVIGQATITFSLVTGNTRIGEIEENRGEVWQPYPNPFVSSLKMRVPEHYEPITTSFSILSLSGFVMPVTGVKWQEKEAELEIAPLQLPKGTYLLQTTHPSSPNKIIKVIKQD